MTLAERLRAIIAVEKLPPRRLRQPAIAARAVPIASIGSGFVDPRQRDGTRRIALTLDEATFARVRDHAAARKISFAAAARELIERAAAQPSGTSGP